MRKKRITVWLCALAMLLSCAAPVAGAAEGVSLELQVPETLPPAGECFEVRLLLTENPGVNTVQIILSYNHAALRCVGIEQGELLRGMLSAENPDAKAGAVIAAAAVEPVTAAGELADFTFEVLIPGEANFSLKGSKFGRDDAEFPLAGTLTYIEAEPQEAEEPITPPSVPDREPAAPPDAPTEDAPPEEPTDAPPDVPPEESTEEPPDAPTGGSPAQAEDEAVLFHFSDVEGHWAEAEIGRAAGMGLVNGREDGSFAPNAKMTRAELVTVLWRMEGKPEASRTLGFPDVSADSWYADAVQWAAAEGIVKGNENGSFDPNSNITREQLAVILFRMSGGVSGMELIFADTYDEHYQDSGEVSAWAKSGVYWAIYKGLIKGTTADMLSPKNTASRAEVVTLLLRYADKIMR